MGAPAGQLSREINAERLVLLGWARAILLQLAHPLIAAGIAEHSTFRSGRLTAASRLHQTIRAMLALTFGDEGARLVVIDRIRGIHRRVHGTLPVAAGRFAVRTPYSAEDPDLLLWVHATLLDSIPLVFDRLVRPLTADERDRYCAEAAWLAVALGARDAEVPRTWKALRAYLEATYVSGSIAVSPQARELADAVLAPPMSGFIAPVAWANQIVTVGLLPDQIRAQYGFGWSPGRDSALTRTLHTLAAVRRIIPLWLAYWPEARR
jgi:uncharacterized protein (DUF2236 family)